jgi:histidinol-phosphate aminotransferase
MGFDFQALLDLVDAHTGLVFITNPDNPSGYAVKAEQLKALARDLPEGCLLVVDEAYIEFADDDLSPLKSWRETDKIVLLRTFSKIYGMAGLRLGYGLMPPWLAEALLRVKLPFSVNILAEQAGIAALKDHLFYDQTRQTVLKGRADLYTGLERLGCQVLPSQANFLFFRTPIPAQGVFEQLLSQGIIIRPLASYGLKDALRVSVGTTEENNCFLKALKEVLAHG